MTEDASRSLLAAEALFLLGPVSVLAALYFALLVGMYGSGSMFAEPADAHVVPAVFAGCCLVLAIAWWVVAAFVVGGRASLARVAPGTMVLLAVAASATAVAAVVALLDAFAGFSVPFAGPLGILCFGLPALLPFGHLAIEWKRARRGATDRPTA